MAFHVGQRVVCVKSGRHHIVGVWDKVPEKGIIYTIRGIMPAAEIGAETDGLYLVEIVNPEIMTEDGGWVEMPFASGRFRPLDESRLDQFRAHLAPAPKPRVSA